MTPCARRVLMLAALSLIAALAVTPAADAASARKCEALAKKKKAKQVRKFKAAMVVKRGSFGNLTLTYYACLYSKPKLLELPDQNGGDTEFLARFTQAGNFLAYVHRNEENAAVISPSWVEVFDLKARKRVGMYDSLPGEDTDGVNQLLLVKDGSVAWIGEARTNAGDVRDVQTALAGAAQATEVDRDPAINPRSLRLGTAPGTFTWQRGGQAQTAAFGGPSVTP